MEAELASDSTTRTRRVEIRFPDPVDWIAPWDRTEQPRVITSATVTFTDRPEGARGRHVEVFIRGRYRTQSGIGKRRWDNTMWSDSPLRQQIIDAARSVL